MNEYEILLMLDPALAEDRANEVIARVRERVDADGGTWDGHEPWGRRKLAYEINHKPEGVYHLLLFTASPATLAEVSRVLKITDGVMRHLAVNRVKGGQTKAPAPVAAVAAALLVSPASENFVFGIQRWNYNNRPGPWRYQFWGVHDDPLTTVSAVTAVAIAVAGSVTSSLWGAPRVLMASECPSRSRHRATQANTQLISAITLKASVMIGSLVA